METRRRLIRLYFSLGYSYKEIVGCLQEQHNIIISIRHMKRLLQRDRLYRRKNKSSVLHVAAYIDSEIEKSGSLHGYRWMHLKCIQNNIVTTQETVRELLKFLDPEGCEIRSRRRLRRRAYYSRGPNFLWHVDSYDKLKPYGICINGCVDGFSRRIIWLEAYVNSSNPKIIAGYYVNAIKNLNLYPLRIRTDRGTENTHMEQMQMFLRRNQDDDFAGENSFLKGASTANQRIEGWWSTLRRQNSQFWIDFFGVLRDSGVFSGDYLDRNLVQFCFMNIIQEELNEVVKVWNAQRIRATRNMNSPNGRPNIMYALPQLYHTRNYGVDVDRREIAVCSEECIFKGRLPCDETVYELACLLMTENNIDAPENCFDAAYIYKFLRNEIRNNLNLN